MKKEKVCSRSAISRSREVKVVCSILSVLAGCLSVCVFCTSCLLLHQDQLLLCWLDWPLGLIAGSYGCQLEEQEGEEAAKLA